MTVRVTRLKGEGAGRYYTERLPSYYLSSLEAPARWWGQAAGRLNFGGGLDPGDFHSLLSGLDPGTGEHLGRRFGEKTARGYDATFSAPKSVSVLWALGDGSLQEQVVEAHEQAVEAVLGWAEDQAHTRLRRHGQIVNVDTGGLVAGLFLEHTSRRLDPQLHTHAVISCRVPAPDGRWLSLDARTIMKDQRTLSALYHANLRAELTRRLGVAWKQPENGIAEIKDMNPEVLAEFSRRSGDVERRLEQKLDRFRENLGRDPTDRERWQLEREAVLDSRPPKPDQASIPALRQEWRKRCLELGHDPDRLVEMALGRQRRFDGVDSRTAARLVDEAITSLGKSESSWRPAALVRELARIIPPTVTADSEQLTEFVEQLATQAVDTRCVDISKPVPEGVELRRDGRPISEAAVDRALTTKAILEQEEQLVLWAQLRLATPSTVRRRSVVQVNGLSPGQCEAVAAVTGTRGLELIVGPAGTGKTTALKSAVLGLRRQGRFSFGVAPTAAAAEVLATETGMSADTLDKLISEHQYSERPPQPEYQLPAGTTVILDEAGATSTPKLAALAHLADEKNWRVVMVGDPRQFSAVGRGGMFAHLVESHGAAELDEVHRFRHHWERQASLRLRTGDVSVLEEYDRRGRIHGGSNGQMEAKIIDAWKDARSRGETVAVMANNNQTVTRLQRLAQQTRIRSGELDPNAPRRQAGETQILVGDEVVTRRNDRRLKTDRGLMVKNRDRWTITGIHRDGTITVTGSTGTIRLPGDYVSTDVELGYVQTSHATQGRTVDTALLLVDGPTDSRGVYTPLTRGRETNQAYVVVEDNQTPLDILAEAIGRDWIDEPAIARRNQLDPHRLKQLIQNSPGDETEVDQHLQEILRSIERRQGRTRETGRSLGRSL